MSPTIQIFLTSALTIIGGIVILVVGQLVTRFLIEPIHEQRKIIGEISDALIFYANVTSNPGTHKDEVMEEASKVLREKASMLWTKTLMIPLYNIMIKMKFVRSMSDIDIASRHLIGLSNSVYSSGDGIKNGEKSDAISKALGLPIVP